MANKTITDLASAIETKDTDVLLIENGTATMKVTKGVLLEDCSKTGHKHNIGDINYLQEVLDDKMNNIELATVATSGNYGDLNDTPHIPSKVSELENDNGYISAVPSYYVIEEEMNAELQRKSDVGHVHKYNEITNVPTIPSKVSELENDNKYISAIPSEYVTENELAVELAKVNDELKEKTDYVAKNTRKFNPKYCFSCFWGETTDTSGGSWTASIAKITKDVNVCKDANVDGFILIVHIGYNATTNNFYIVEDLDVLQNGIDLMKENHIQPKAIKLHAQKYSSSDITTFGEDNFKTTWKNFITQIGEKFADCGFEYLTVHNEVKYIYNNNAYTDFVLECFELARNMGYKTGITNAGFEEACHGTILEILDNADAIFVNHYQPITNKGSKIQKQLGVDAWEYSFCMNYIDHLYCKYDKPIIISESGVQDYWCALAQPSKYSWSETQETNGEAPYVYLYGAFEVLNCSPIAELWSWYDIDYPIVKNLIKYYMGGIYNE